VSGSVVSLARSPRTILPVSEHLPASASWRDFAQLVVALGGVSIGGGLALFGFDGAAAICFATATGVVLVPTLVSTAQALARRHPGVDLIAVLSMGGALALGEYLAGAILAVMMTGGLALERFAVLRARRELSALLARAPRIAHRKNEQGELDDVAIERVAIGEILVVKPGEVVPVDGVLVSERAVLDEAALTGESRPVDVAAGLPLRSGGNNAGGPFEMRVTAAAEDSTFAAIVRLVRDAEQAKAPFERLADRYALAFVLVTLVLSGLAWWVAGSPVRALAVLVVATPCPLLLAAPTAILAGVSRAARRGVLVKGGGPLEALARANILLLDKTGTVTRSRPEVAAVEVLADGLDADGVLAAAASLEQFSLHPYAPAIVAEARARGIAPSFPVDVEERVGTGIRGVVDGREVAVGRLAFVAPDRSRWPARVAAIETRTAVEGSAGVFVGRDGVVVGAVLLQDLIRPDAPRVLRELRRVGFARIYMVTGDRPDVADLVGDALGIDRVFAERAPDDKVEVVEAVRGDGVVAMVGDGINDAPALARADVGIAMGARGATAASQAADIVLTGDDLVGLVAGVHVARRTQRIARESVVVGMGLSFVAMGFAAAGLLAPVFGAIVQECIDVLVIGNALRALAPGRGERRMSAAAGESGRRLARQLDDEHRVLRPRVQEFADLAARLDTMPPDEARSALVRVRTLLERDLLPHELEEQRTVYPVLVEALDGEDPTGPLVRTHQEINRLTRLFGRLVDRLPDGGPRPDDLHDLRRVLFGLHAILMLHFSQEDELYSVLSA
jgi:heavy metal translocating P-type ATPase